MNIFEVNKVHDRLYILGERMNDVMVNAIMLVIGEKKAALIDTGLGSTGDLDSFVRQLTQLPVMVLGTHGDPDHVGAHALFEEVFMSRLDHELLPWALSRTTRLEMAGLVSPELREYAKTHSVSERPFEYHDIHNGDTYDLGGTVLEAVMIPGHTKGSAGFINRGEKYAFLGDSINPVEWMWLERCTPMAVYLRSLKMLKFRIAGIETLYCGHLMDPVPPNTIDELIAAAGEIVAGDTWDDQPAEDMFVDDPAKPFAMRHAYGGVTVIYNRRRIF